MAAQPVCRDDAGMNSPLVICGCPGSGTSLVTKMLRHAGLFTGSDSGPIEARKYHESQCFKQYNIQFLTRTIDFPHAPKSVQQFETHNSRMKENLDEIALSVDRDSLLAEYWSNVDESSAHQAWGWKDPRNSATVMIWREIFPQLRVIVVCRNWKWRDRWKSGGSDSGNWYRKQSTAEIRKLYQNPIGIDANSMLHVDVDRFTTDANLFADVLAWSNLNQNPASEFEHFLATVGFER